MRNSFDLHTIALLTGEKGRAFFEVDGGGWATLLRRYSVEWSQPLQTVSYWTLQKMDLLLRWSASPLILGWGGDTTGESDDPDSSAISAAQLALEQYA